MSKPHDAVSNPEHYIRGGLEVIDIIESFELGWHLGNVVKYVLRAGRKSGSTALEDLRKARWYLERLITRMEGK